MLRVMTFNVLCGAQKRLPAVLDLIRAAGADLLVLQECVGWEQGDALLQVAEALGVPWDHALLGQARPRPSGARYHVAVLGKAPVQLVALHDDPAHLGHCILVSRVGPVTVFATHFDSHSEDLRLTEARYLNGLLGEEVMAGQALLMGDLNALSRRDPYPDDLSARLLRAGIGKYGHPPRFDTIDEIERAGWVDALAARRTSAAWATAPRRGVDLRTDYVFCSPGLAGALRGAAVVDVGAASDHHAVVADFAL